MLDTPLGSISFYFHPCVYEPAEDTLLAIEVVIELLSNTSTTPRRVLDLGSGSGVIGAAISRGFGSFVVAVDINHYASLASENTLDGRGISLLCDWATCFKQASFDLVILNPPYLPVRDVLKDCPLLPKAWGASPKELERACRHGARVSSGGLIIVYSSLSGWAPFECLRNNGFKVIVRKSKSFFMETIWGVGAWRFHDYGKA